MTLLEMLNNKPDLILLDSTEWLVRANLQHYKQLSPESIRLKLFRLFRALVKTVEVNSCSEVIKYMKNISEERFDSGYELYEVQTALNILEESLWKNIAKYVDEEKQVESLKLITCILGSAKEELAADYSLYCKEQVPA